MSGASSNQRGKARERQYAAWLRDNGWPHAEVSPVHGRPGDLTGVGDRVAEITIRPYEKLPEKLRQAENDARAAGLAEFLVWKPMNRAPGEPGTVAQSIVIMRAEVAWPLLAEVDRLRAADKDFGRGYSEGWNAALAAIRDGNVRLS